MQKWNQLLVTAGVAACFCLGANQAVTQGGPGSPALGSLNPEQMWQRGAEKLRQAFEVKDDAEWQIVEEQARKVYDLRVEMIKSLIAAARQPGGDTLPEAGALKSAIAAKSSNEKLKAAMERFRQARQAKEDKLLQAQADLKKILTIRQEAIALGLGLVN
jgi:hypothetical protein